YSKNYTGDRRIGYGSEGTNAPGINRYLNWGLGIRAGRVVQSGNQYNITNTFQQQFVKRIYSKAYTQADGHRLFAVNDALLHWNDDQYENLSSLVSGNGNIRSMLADNPAEVFVHCVTGSGASLVNKVLRVNLLDHNVAEVNLSVADPYNLESSFTDLIRLADGRPYFVRLYPYQMKLVMWEITDYNTLTHRRVYNSSGFGDTYGAYSLNKLVVAPRADNSMDIFAWVHDPVYGANNIHGGRMYYSCLSAYVSNDDPLVPALLPLALHAYPNPARGTMRVSLDGIKQQTHQVCVYNIRGQKVMDLGNFQRNDDGSISMLWDGRDSQGKRLAGGVYMLKAIVDGKEQISKRVTLIW
ncbi:MAG: T9SS type A sorting domain-containing protein, partial [Candidatus Cloacimonadaceae bacterium]|nr:T9SS type A sorting domain-containing protein [Candidatus Cloacimonadaceae bacterium]